MESPRPSAHRQRSNSLPIVEALGCSTPEAQLLLAEGRAAVRKRRAKGQRNRSVNDNDNGTTTYHPQDHLKYLQSSATPACSTYSPVLPEARSCHARVLSNATDRSTSTIVPQTSDGDTRPDPNPASPLGTYSANLAHFIKAQLKSIPTYQPNGDTTSPLSPRSCPDFSFPATSPPLSPNSSAKRAADAPKLIDIPPVRPPARSAFSAWSSTDDDTDDDALSLPEIERYTSEAVSKASSGVPSVLGYYETSTNSSFLFSSTPLEEVEEPETAKASTFPDQSALLGSTAEPHCHGDAGYPSSCLSHPQLTSSSAPSYSSSSASASSYFECKRPHAIAPQLKDRIIAALTPPHPQGKTIAAISPWEGAAIANVHDVFVESHQRVHVDGMSFDMLRDFITPSRITTPV